MEWYRVQRISSISGKVLEDSGLVPFGSVKSWYQSFLYNAASNRTGYVAVFQDTGNDLRYVHPSRFGWK